MVQEKVLEFGSNSQLVGILSYPPDIDPNLPAIIFINAGVLHRTGACRSSVTFARSLSSRGYICLRFDLHGIGDSGFGGSRPDDELQTKPEIKDALDKLEESFGIKRFVMHGLCSGARDAFATAVTDDRVVGLSMIDSYAYRNLRFYLNKIFSLIKEPNRWLNALKVRISPPLQTVQNDNDLMQIPVWPDEYPPHQLIQSYYSQLIKRKVRILATYTGSWIGEYNYKCQFYDMYPKLDFGDLLTINFMPSADHLTTDKKDRNQVCEKLLSLASSL